VFDTLRDELANDPLIAGQPEFSKAWMQRVSKKNVVSAWELPARLPSCWEPHSRATAYA